MREKINENKKITVSSYGNFFKSTVTQLTDAFDCSATPPRHVARQETERVELKMIFTTSTEMTVH